MLVWLFALVTLLLVTPVLFASAHLAKRLSRQQRQGFARRASPETTAVDGPAPLTRKKSDWVVQEVLRISRPLHGRLQESKIWHCDVSMLPPTEN